MDLDLQDIDLSELGERGPKEEVRPGSDKSYRLAKFWHAQIDEVSDEYKKWVKRGRAIERRYRDERQRSEEEGNRRVNNLWANVEILYPALYGKQPMPIAERRFRDKDVVGRGAAQILERALRNELEISGYDEAVGQAVKDYLLPGRGTVWVRYEPEIGPGISIPVEEEMDLRDDQGDIVDDESEEEIKLRDTGDRVTRESTPVDYIQWTDFFVFPAKARTWKEVTAVGKRVYMTRDQMVRRFGEKIGEEIPLEKDDRERKRLNESIVPDSDSGRKGQVYEIWCKADEHVYWVAEGYDYLCDYQEDPLKLEFFYPCPRPLFANATTSTLVPVPDFLLYQDQAVQIDDLTNRISMLAKACKVAGVYNAAADSIKRLLDESVENELIPVDDWAAFAEKGGVEGNISFLPLKEIIGCLTELIQVKALIVQEMDRLTGITDIIRGTTDARETLGAQRLKQNSQGTRLQRRQNEVARFCRDTIRLMAEIMAIHFSPQSLIEVSGALLEEGLGVVDAPAQPPGPNPGAAPPPAGNLLPPAQGQAPGAVPGPPSTPGAAPANPMPPQAPGLPVPQGPMGMASSPQNAPMSPQGPLQGFGMGEPGLPPGLPPELLAKIEGLKRIAAAIQLLRNEKLRGFRVDIETDSTIFGDSQQEKQDRIEFIGAVTKFVQEAGMIAMQMPQAAPMLGKMLQFGVRGFRVGRDLESSIEDFTDEAEKSAKQHAANPQPNPEQIKAQAQMAQSQAEIQKAQLDAQSNIQNAQFDKQRADVEMQMRQMEMQIKQLDFQADQQKNQVEMAKIGHDQRSAEVDHQRGLEQANVEMQKMGMDRDNHAQKLQLEQQARELEMQLKRMEYEHNVAKNQLDMQKAQREEELASAKHQSEMAKHQREMELGAVQHKQTMDEQLHGAQVTQLQRRQEIEKTVGEHTRNEEAASTEHKRKMSEELLKSEGPVQTVKAVKSTTDTFTKAMEKLVEMAEAMKESVEKLDDIAETLEATAAKTLAPKEIVRDPKTGRATGVRTVLQ